MQMLLISSSIVHGRGYLDHAEPEIRNLGVKRVAFVPFALADRIGYTAKVSVRLSRMGIEVRQFDGVGDLDGVDGLFVGGGNTWRLLKSLYEVNAIEAIRERVRGGLAYIGSSAGTNITAPTIRTTNDMPIVQPPSFEALGLVPYQINPHYLDPDPASTHQGETREERLLQFLEENDAPVIGLREGSMLRVHDGVTTLVGAETARIFRRGSEPFEAEPGPIDAYVGR